MRKIETGAEISTAELGAVLLAAISRQGEDLSDFAGLVMAEFERANGQFEKVDGHFKRIDGQFQGIDGRFQGVDGRLKGIDGQFKRMDGQFEEVHKRIGGLRAEIGRVEYRLGKRIDFNNRKNSARFEWLESQLSKLA